MPELCCNESYESAILSDTPHSLGATTGVLQVINQKKKWKREGRKKREKGSYITLGYNIIKETFHLCFKNSFLWVTKTDVDHSHKAPTTNQNTFHKSSPWATLVSVLLPWHIPRKKHIREERVYLACNSRLVFYHKEVVVGDESSVCIVKHKERMSAWLLALS